MCWTYEKGAEKTERAMGMVNYGGFSYITLDKSKLQMDSNYQKDFLSTDHRIWQKQDQVLFQLSKSTAGK